MTTYTQGDSATIFWGDHEDFDDEPVAEFDNGSGRWHQYITRVYRRTADGSLWGVDGALGLTEYQEHEFNDPPFQVESRERLAPARVITVYFNSDGKQLGNDDDSSDWEASEFDDSGPLIVYCQPDGCALVLRGEWPHPDFERNTIMDEMGIATPGVGLWAWVDEGSSTGDDDLELWNGHWRSLTVRELASLNGAS